MDYRHEWKHEIGYPDLLALRRRLAAVMDPDPHAANGKYDIRSLYFDNLADRALREKLDGVNGREKFRIRCYNGSAALLLLEKKSKINGLCRKEQEPLSREEVRRILRWDMAPPPAGRPLLAELCRKMALQGLRPRTIVDYTREPFVFGPGNVRVTLDHHIRTGLAGTDLLDPGCVTIPVRGDPIILEVKWDAFLPTVIRDAVQVPGTHTSAYSKYAACRVFG